MFTVHQALGSVKPDPNRHIVLGTPLDMEPGPGEEVIYVAAGCFWGVEKIMWETPGVVSTATGYMGGDWENPTYRQVCTGRSGHAETVRVVYDSSLTSAAQILATFFEIHDPTQGNRQGNDVGPQYRSAIWTTTPGQLHVARAARHAYEERIAEAGFGPITTSIDEAGAVGRFWQAEDEHQGYLWHHPNGYQCHVRTGIACPVVPEAT